MPLVGAKAILLCSDDGNNVRAEELLQSNSTDLAAANWLDVVGTPTVSGAEQFLQFAVGSGRVFFRLRKL